jgi:hypothetical protein
METVYWTMKDGKKISIDDMDINHLRNSLKMVVRGLERLKLQQKKSIPKFELKGDIAQNHFDTMMDMEWADEMNYHQGL